MNHALYSLIAGHRKRRELGRLLVDSPLQGTTDVDLVDLKSSGITELVFDFDGVLAPHGADEPLAETLKVLEQAQEVFGASHIYILSNKPSVERLNFFSRAFPALHFVGGVRKKPYPDGLLKIASIAEVASERIALLDDRLLTGGLACLNAGARFIYISKPYVDYSRNVRKELFFASLRKIEAFASRLAAN